MSVLEGWNEAPLGEVCRIVAGGTPKTDVSQYWGGQIAWLTPNDLSKDRSQTLSGGERTLTPSGYDSCSAKLFPPGSVVVSSRAPVGYVAIAGAEMSTNQGCKTAVPPDFIDSKFLYWYMLNAKQDLEARASGTTFKEISGKRFAETILRWPEMSEQRRIVDTLEDHVSRLDAADRLLDQSHRRLATFQEQAVVNAVTGRVRRGRTSPTQLAAAGTSDGELPRLPEGWSWRRLGEVAEVVGGVTKDAKKQSDPSYVEVPYLRVANVQRGRLDLSRITLIRVPKGKALALSLQPGDVLLNEGGDRDKLARGWVWEGQVNDCIHQNHVFRARVRDGVLDPFFLSFVANTLGGRWAERNGKQSVNLASISLSMIRKMPVPVPPHDQQQSVVTGLRNTLEAISRVRLEVETARRRTELLRRALLAAAFAGRLTGRASDPDREEMLTT